MCIYIYTYTSVLLCVDTHRVLCGTICEVEPIEELIWSKVGSGRKFASQRLSQETITITIPYTIANFQSHYHNYYPLHYRQLSIALSPWLSQLGP